MRMVLSAGQLVGRGTRWIRGGGRSKEKKRGGAGSNGEEQLIVVQ